MLFRAGRSMSRLNILSICHFPFERVIKRYSNACVLLFPFERVIKRYTNANLLPRFHSNALQMLLERMYFTILVRTRHQTLHERKPSVSISFEPV